MGSRFRGKGFNLFFDSFSNPRCNKNFAGVNRSGRGFNPRPAGLTLGLTLLAGGFFEEVAEAVGGAALGIRNEAQGWGGAQI